MSENLAHLEETPIKVGAIEVPPGESRRADIPIAGLPMQDDALIPVQVFHGRFEGPRLWLSAAIHGDELNGVEIIRELCEAIDLDSLHGSVIAVPIVNIFGFLYGSRYFPDRRDLNRSFPGSSKGSLASRTAYLLMNEVVSQCSHGLDLHTGSNDRENLPHVRGNLEDLATREMAEAFGAPIMIHGSAPEGSLRDAAGSRGKVILTYEAGGPFRFDESAISVGLEGVKRVMKHLKMQDFPLKELPYTVRETSETKWLRAEQTGILRLMKASGDSVSKGEVFGHIGGAFHDKKSEVVAPFDGLIISHTKNPIVYEGDALVHVAR